MSNRLDGPLPLRTRPTRSGTRRRPPAREIEQKRPAPVYRRALEISFARMIVIETLRDDGFKTT